MKFLVIGGFADLGFRGPLIAALQGAGLQVHVAAPGLQPGLRLGWNWSNGGLTVHSIPLRRTGTNPLSDLRVLLRARRAHAAHPACWVLGYTVKPVIYGSLAAWLAGVPYGTR